jgi:murein DD-endopeptidase MepM/ murein hydrolase activator NlpD
MRRLLLPLAVLAVLLGAMHTAVGSQQSTSDARAEREEVREEKAAAARELDAAKADDEAVYAALVAITSSVNAYQAEIDDARRQLEDARGQVAAAEAAIAEADAAERNLLDELADLAVAGYVSGGEQPSAMFESADITEALRQNSLLDQANGDTADLLEQLRSVQEDRELAAADADAALVEAELLEVELADDLVVIEAEQAVQEELKAELERRVADWQSKVDELAAADAELTRFIREQEAAAAAAAGGGSTAPAPGSSSVSGFQWPINGGVSSGYGYRIHPIYGTRRLHTGLDISGGSGTPIAAAKGGTVLSAGWRGGYGNAVVISHGGGITTLYAHQSQMNVSNGQQVSRGDIIGWVGSTGASTGPHLHFEVRVNGSPVNPRPYLP